MLDELLPGATSGNRTAVEIDAPPEVVWQALTEVTVRELRLTRALLAARALPALVARSGTLARRASKSRGPNEDSRPETLLAALGSSRFTVLHEEPGQMMVLGVIGQFWKVSGGIDVEFADRAEFEAFDRPGFVKSAIDFVIEPSGSGTRLSTETRNQTTDDHAARRFGRYWRLVGWGSKATRLDMVRSVKRRAERLVA